MNKFQLLQNNLNTILKNRELYWNNGEPEITDFDYIKLVHETELLYSDIKSELSNEDKIKVDYILNSVEHSKLTNLPKVKHKKRLYSLKNAFSFNDIQQWLNNVCQNSSHVLYADLKCDGVDLSKENGLLTTRGDGIIGENITHIYPLILNKFELESNIDDTNGELFIRKSEFEKTTIVKNDGDKYKNPRSLVSGIINNKSIDHLIGRVALEFFEFKKNIICFKYSEFNETLFNDIVDTIVNANSDIPSDGIVFGVLDDEYLESLGYTDKYPKGKIAYKFKDDYIKTKIVNVTLQCGKNKLTPVIHVVPIIIDGTTISKISGHNMKVLIDNNIHINDFVYVTKRGSVIPYISRYEINPIISERKPLDLNTCPACNGDLEYHEPELYCINESCDGKLKKQLYTSCKILCIEEIGIQTINKLIEQLHTESILDIFNLTIDNILTLDGFSEISSKKLYSNIQKVINTGIEDWKILSALNLIGIGSTIFKELMKKYSINELIQLNESDLLTITNIGNERASIIYRGLHDNKDLIEKLFVKLNVITTKLLPNQQKSNLSICFSGNYPKPKLFYENLAKNKGFDVTDKVTKSLSYLVTSGSHTSKKSQAEKYGINILSLDEFLELVK